MVLKKGDIIRPKGGFMRSNDYKIDELEAAVVQANASMYSLYVCVKTVKGAAYYNNIELETPYHVLKTHFELVNPKTEGLWSMYF